MKPGSRERLLMAIAKARKWIQEIERGQGFRAVFRVLPSKPTGAIEITWPE
jgi:hypothetical protein